jgi:hypothetical protein
VSRWKTGVLSTHCIGQKFIGVVSTESEIWFFEKKIRSKKIAKKLRKNWKFAFFLNNIFLNIFLIFNFRPYYKFDFFLFFDIWNLKLWIFLKNHISVSVLTTLIPFWSLGRYQTLEDLLSNFAWSWSKIIIFLMIWSWSDLLIIFFKDHISFYFLCSSNSAAVSQLILRLLSWFAYFIL